MALTVTDILQQPIIPTKNLDRSCIAHAEMVKQWLLIRDLLGGTIAMRARGKKWLPMEDRETKQSYQVRLERSILFGAFRDTVRRLRSKPFSKPVMLEGAVPPDIGAMTFDVDGEGSDLTQFGSALFDDAASYGMTHVLVDYPAIAGDGETRDEIATRVRAGDEAAMGLRAHFVHVPAHDLIYWKSSKGRSGVRELTEIRIVEYEADDKDDGTEQEVKYVRRITPVDWQRMKLENGKDWKIVEQGPNTLGRIPLVTIYFQRKGFMSAEPPLQELAWLNLAHYQSDSDQRNILRFARFGTLFMKGVTDEEKEQQVTIGPAKIIRASSTEADLKVVEHSGKAVEAGRLDLQDLEARMELLGLQPLMSRTGGATATGQAIDESKVQNDVQAWVRALETGLCQAFEIAGEWMNTKVPDSFAVNIFSEFGLTMRSAEDIRNLIAMRQGGLISQETFLREVRRRALLAETVDPQEEMQRIAEEGPAVDGLTGMASLAAMQGAATPDPTQSSAAA